MKYGKVEPMKGNWKPKFDLTLAVLAISAVLLGAISGTFSQSEPAQPAASKSAEPCPRLALRGRYTYGTEE